MSLPKRNRIQHLLANWPSGMVATTAWLNSLGISKQLVQKYLDSGWVSALGKGAYCKHGDQSSIWGACFAMQAHLKVPIHMGALSALELKGFSHYVRVTPTPIYIFTDLKSNIPLWFKKTNWKIEPRIISTTFLPIEAGMTKHTIEGFELNISSPERAILEMLYLAPKHLDLVEAYQVLEGLQTLRPILMQELLQQRNSIKVKRLFLFMAKKAQLPVLPHLNLQEIDLGSGPRSITPEGVYDSTFKLILPKELMNYD
jgi:hypothetical protein